MIVFTVCALIVSYILHVCYICHDIIGNGYVFWHSMLTLYTEISLCILLDYLQWLFLSREQAVPVGLLLIRGIPR